jgi:hypothetical protein
VAERWFKKAEEIYILDLGGDVVYKKRELMATCVAIVPTADVSRYRTRTKVGKQVDSTISWHRRVR